MSRRRPQRSRRRRSAPIEAPVLEEEVFELPACIFCSQPILREEKAFRVQAMEKHDEVFFEDGDEEKWIHARCLPSELQEAFGSSRDYSTYPICPECHRSMDVCAYCGYGS